MRTKLIQMRRLDLLTEFSGSWGKESGEFLNPVLENNKLISLSNEVFLSKSEIPGRFIFMIRKELYERTGSDLASLENLFNFLTSNHAKGMEKELKKVVNERFENGTLHTEVDKDDLISLNEIGLVLFKKLTLNDWLEENFLASKAISKVKFYLMALIALFVILYLRILSTGFVYGITSFLAALAYIVLALLMGAAIKALSQFKNDNEESLLVIQKQLIESVAYDEDELKDKLFGFVEAECKKLKRNDSIMSVHFGEEKIDELYQSLYHEKLTESIDLASNPFYHFEKLKSELQD